MLNPDRPPPDTRDEEEHAAVRAILEELPPEHPARSAYAKGVGTLQLTHLVGRRDLADRLTEAWTAGYGRTLRKSTSFRP